MRKAIVLSIGSESRPCCRTAVWRSEPACWNAATRRSVPEPVTPPNTTAEIGAEMIAETMPHDQARDRDVGDPDVAAQEQQHEQAEDRGDEPERDRRSRGPRRTATAVDVSPKNLKSAPA